MHSRLISILTLSFHPHRLHGLTQHTDDDCLVLPVVPGGDLLELQLLDLHFQGRTQVWSCDTKMEEKLDFEKAVFLLIRLKQTAEF